MKLINNLFGKTASDVSFEDISNLLLIQKEEDRFLEYKLPDILATPEKLSKYISAFLNSEGGIIVIGIGEDKPKEKDRIEAKICPQKIEFVDMKYTKERIEQIIFSNIYSSTKPAINIYPIRQKNNNNSVYLIEILQGDNPPYQAADGKYYRRLNATTYSMPHSEIADFFGKRRKPLLGLRIEVLSVSIIGDYYHAIFRFLLGNAGKAIAKNACFTASFTNVAITDILKGRLSRIDDLRDNMPTIQFSDPQAIFYPYHGLTRIGEAYFKIKAINSPIKIVYTLIAEDMEFYQDEFNIKGSSIVALMKAHESDDKMQMFLETSHLTKNRFAFPDKKSEFTMG